MPLAVNVGSTGMVILRGTVFPVESVTENDTTWLPERLNVPLRMPDELMLSVWPGLLVIA